MPNARAATWPPPSEQTELLSMLERFDRAWQGKTPPRIDEFLPPRSGLGGADKDRENSRRARLEELIKIDLEYRWRRASLGRAESPTRRSDEISPDHNPLPSRPLLEDYLAHYDDLGSSEPFSPALIGEEYRVRRRWGDRPGREEYMARFAFRCEDLDSALAAIDAELASETGPAGCDATVAPPARIGKYLVIEMLDKGGQAQVFRVHHPELGKDFALKLAKRAIETGTGSQAEPAGGDRLLREGRMLARCEHPNLVRVVDQDIHEGRPFVVMEYVPGMTLEQFVDQHRPSPRRAARLVAEVATAVAYLHDRGIVHQDIKPRNVLVDVLGHPQLIDFGLARSQHAWSGGAVDWSGGTAAYMSPEQALGRADRIGPRTDVFGLGGLLYHMLTGHPLYQGTSHLSVLRQATEAGYVPVRQINRRVPRGLERICHKALAADPERRHATAVELERAMRRFLARRRVVVACLAAIYLAAITSMTVAWTVPGPRLAPLKIDAFDIRHFRFRGDDPAELSAIGVYTEPVIEDDRLRVSAQLGVPAYSYLIALNPDGKDQLCLPPDQSEPPSLSREIHFGETTYFPLTDGSGQQAFVVAASRKPLPPYEKWEGRDVLRRRWRHVATDKVHGIWAFKEGKFELVSRAQRGPLEQRPEIRPAPFRDVCDELKKRPDIEAIQAIAFPVWPKE